MDRINGLSHIMESLRKQFTENATRANKGETSKRPKETSRSARTRRKISIKQLENRITERIQLLDRQSGEYSRQATHIFVESVIVWEFGEQILNDSRFPEMARAIVSTLDGDEKVRDKMQALIDKMV